MSNIEQPSEAVVVILDSRLAVIAFSVWEFRTAREMLFNDWRARQALKLSAPVFSVNKAGA